VNAAPTPILLVDDITANLTALTGILAAPQVRLLSARSGAEALEILLRQDVAVALIDVQMPEMDGFELVALMRGSARTKQVPVIFLTAGDRDQGRLFHGYETGAVDFLYKPIDALLLHSKVAVFVELYERRRQLAREIDKLNEMIAVSDQFISVLGHDLRSPASTIALAAELLLSQESDPRRVDLLNRILRSNLRMNRLVAQLLDFARARLGGAIPVSPVPLDLGEVVRSAVKEFNISGVQVELDEHGDVHGSADEDRLGQVLSNLLSNAVAHGTSGAPITLQLDGSLPDRIMIRVHNQGVIPDEVMARMFAPGSYNRPGSSGLGLGLYIVDQIVRAHGGTIACTSSLAAGTSFRIELPRTTPP
jgi:signal transduction histidine kinase